MKLKYEFAVREILGDYIFVPLGEAALAFQGMLTTNEVGVVIWNTLKNEVTKEQVIESVLESFEIDKETATLDVEEFLEKLRKLDLLEESES